MVKSFKLFNKVIMVAVTLVVIGMLLPEKLIIPVEGASSKDWNHDTFWYEPWGTSGVHKGIDIFGTKGAPVLASTAGIVLYTGSLSKGGNVVAVLGPKWRIHYFAHLNDYSVETGDFLKSGSIIGTLGDTGNAAGKQPHVHYSIFSTVPIPWLATTEQQGWKKMFFLNPHQKLV